MLHLTRRQLYALQAAANGKTIKEWARDLGITPDTAKKHAEKARFKLGACSIAQAVAMSMRRGLIK